MSERPPYYLEKQLINLIRSGNLPSAEHILTEINQFPRAELADLPLRSLRNSLICSCAIFSRAVIEGGVTSELAFALSDRLINEIETIDNFERLSAFEYKMLSDFIRLITNVNSMVYSDLVRKTIEYIHIHLTEKLSLHTITEYVYVHPNYLSARFKKEVGMTMSEYIMDCRVRECCYFIKHSDYTFSEIACRYQFCNQSHFIRAFKKIRQMTPLQYKNFTGEVL